MNLKDYIFCALDFSDLNQTIEFTDIIKNDIGGIKLGLEFFASNGPAGVEKLKKFKLPIFLDLKLHDIPNMLQNNTNMNKENMNEKYGFAFEPAVSLIILEINE